MPALFFINFFRRNNMADENAQQIAENSLAPKRARGDEGEFEQHSIDDQIKGDRYKRSVAAAKKSPLAGVSFIKVAHGGTS
jgi:hypothetical protein